MFQACGTAKASEDQITTRPERTSDSADQGKIKQSLQRFMKNNGAVRSRLMG